MPRPFRFTDKAVLITGAGSGIGRALAVRLAGTGARLVLTDRDQRALHQTAALLPDGVTPMVRPLDVTDREAVRALPAEVQAEIGGLDVLINNAGIALGGSFEQVDADDFDRVMDVNFGGVVRMTRAFLPLLKARPEARLVNISSLFGLISPPGQAAYSASKFAVRGFSNALAAELYGASVGVTVIHPGGVATAIARSAKTPPGVAPEEVEARLATMEKMLRLSPDRAADIIVRGIEKRKRRVLVGNDAKIAALMERIAPVRHLDLLIKRFAQKDAIR